MISSLEYFRSGASIRSSRATRPRRKLRNPFHTSMNPHRSAMSIRMSVASRVL